MTFVINEFLDEFKEKKIYPKIYFEIPRATLGPMSAHIGIIRPFCGTCHAIKRFAPSLNTSNVPGFSLAMSLWTVSTNDAE